MKAGILVTIFLSLLVLAVCNEGNRVLVLLDGSTKQGSFSLFFGDLEARGYKLTFAQADEASLELAHFGEYLFDHLVVFAPSTDVLGGLTVQTILDFVDSGHNLIVAGDSQGDVGRQIARECGVELSEPGFQVHDNFHGADGDETTISFGPSNLVKSPVVIGTKVTKSVLFKGISLTIPQQNGLHFSVLGGYDSTYSASSAALKQSDLSSGVGDRLVLIAALQARNNARVIISGSLSFFSDKFFRNSDNQLATQALSQWMFRETGVLRVSNVTNHNEAGIEPTMYTIKDTIVYTATIQEQVAGQWVPFISDNVQLEVAMLDPYIRTALKHQKDGLYKTSFVAPDVYGVFSFKLRFRGLGYTSLDTKTVKSIRPYRHDEYPRFLTTANPYYASSLAVLVGVVIFSAFFLFTK